MSKNVTIPLSLLDQLIDLLGHWDVSDCDYFVRCAYHDVSGQLAWKKQKVTLRDAYVQIIQADNQDDRDLARFEYLRKKCLPDPEIPF